MRSILIVLCVVALSSPWVIYRRNHKKKLVCKEDVSNTTMDDSSEESPVNPNRRRRDIDIDLTYKQPIIYLGRKNKTSRVVDDDFDLVSDQLSDDEIEEVKQHIRDTCKALKIT